MNIKKVLVGHRKVDPKSKLMMVNLARVLVGKVHPVHKYKTIEENFYFTSSEGQVKIDGEIEDVIAGDRIIVPAKVFIRQKIRGRLT